jgi:hypothetical protein
MPGDFCPFAQTLLVGALLARGGSGAGVACGGFELTTGVGVAAGVAVGVAPGIGVAVALGVGVAVTDDDEFPDEDIVADPKDSPDCKQPLNKKIPTSKLLAETNFEIT